MRRRKIWPHKIWSRLFQVKRSERRLQRKFKAAAESHVKELAELRARHEEQLELERSRFFQMQAHWASRFIEAFKLEPLQITDLEAGVTDPKYRVKPTDPDPEEMLQGSAFERFQEEKERFFTEGVSKGVSPAGIMERWKEVKTQILEDLM